MGIRIEIKQREETIPIDTLRMGATFQTIKERDLYLVCSEFDDLEDAVSIVNLSTGRVNSPKDFDKIVIPINLVITKE